MSKDILLIGTYTEVVSPELQGHGDGILVAKFDPLNGSITVRSTLYAPNPSYLAAGRSNTIYAVSERSLAEQPCVYAFSINHDLSLQLLNTCTIGGGYPCHLAFQPELSAVLVACYETGHITLHPVTPEGLIQPAQRVIMHEGKSIHPERQQSAHPHMILTAGNRFFVTDLGMDEVSCYTRDTEICRISVPKGSGPRHAVMHPEGKHLFVLNELTATISLIRCNDTDCTLLSTVSILPPGSLHAPGAAAIRITADGRFIYASDRGNNGIAVIRFDIVTETMELVAFVSTEGMNPRDIQLDQSGNWLLSANMDSDTISVFSVNKSSGDIAMQNQVKNIASPSCLCWLR